MPATRIILTVLLHLIICQAVFSQLLRPVYNFQKDDTVLKRVYYEQALQNKNKLTGSLGSNYKKDYQEIYEARFKEVAGLLQSNRSVTDPVAHNYLQSILKKILDANPELKSKDTRLLFSRDWWPNAFQHGRRNTGSECWPNDFS